MKTLTLADDQLQLEFSAQTGALVGMTALATGWKILDRPHLGLSFRLFVPQGRRRNNPVEGQKHKLASFAKTADGKGYTFVWDGVDSPHAGHLDIRVEITVRLETGKAVWSCTLLNRSNLVIEAAYVPYLGDLKPAAGATSLWLTGTSYVEPWSTQLWPKFNNHKGYFGVDYPTAMNGGHYNNMPMNPFFTLTDDRQGLYIGVEGRAWEYVVPQAEARPGYSRSIDGTLPAADQISQHEVSTRLGLIHFPYVQPGQTRALQPIGIAHFQGQCTAGADLYRRSAVRPPAAQMPAWLRDPHSWLQIQVNSPEGEARTRPGHMQGQSIFLPEWPGGGKCDAYLRIAKGNGFALVFNANKSEAEVEIPLDASVGLDPSATYHLARVFPEQEPFEKATAQGRWKARLPGGAAWLIEIEPHTIGTLTPNP